MVIESASPSTSRYNSGDEKSVGIDERDKVNVNSDLESELMLKDKRWSVTKGRTRVSAENIQSHSMLKCALLKII